MCGIFFYAGYKGEKIDGRKKRELNGRFSTFKHRGPDASKTLYLRENVMFGFHRLAIVDQVDGMQPFQSGNFVCAANGEIYNYKELIQEFNLQPISKSDCEIVLLLFIHFLQNSPSPRSTLSYDALNLLVSKLDGEFTFVIYDVENQVAYYGVDQLRTRPLFVGTSREGFYLASEQKALTGLNVSPIKSGMLGQVNTINLEQTYYRYYDFESIFVKISFEDASSILRNIFLENVKIKMQSEREVGYLLSGGLDSSLVCGIAASASKARIRTFTVGFDKNAPDVLAGLKVAKHINSIHTTYIFSYQDGIDVLKEVIGITETWDQTSIRASIPMYLLLRQMKRHYPDIGVIMSGEISDELLMGYMEWKLSPSLEESKAHSIKRLKDISYFDGLRADRVVTSVGCELRLPFFSKGLLDFVLSLDPMYLAPQNNKGIEKYLLRKAFDKLGYIPEDVLWRTKHAFSDATSIVGKDSWKESLIRHAEEEVTDSRFAEREVLYSDNTPQTKEDMLYRELFDEFDYTSTCIPYKWLPNWSSQVDASATALSVFSSNF